VVLLLSGAGLGIWVSFCSDTDAGSPDPENFSWTAGAQVAHKSLMNNTTQLVATDKELTHSSFCSVRGVIVHNGIFFC